MTNKMANKIFLWTVLVTISLLMGTLILPALVSSQLPIFLIILLGIPLLLGWPFLIIKILNNIFFKREVKNEQKKNTSVKRPD